jgi:hypothetical protein
VNPNVAVCVGRTFLKVSGISTICAELVNTAKSDAISSEAWRMYRLLGLNKKGQQLPAALLDQCIIS